MRWTVIACLVLAACEVPSTTLTTSEPDVDVDVDTEAPPPCEEVAWYADLDGDGFGDPDSTVWACEAPADTVARAQDCDDGDAFIRPGAEERCDGRDQDCDGFIDEDATDAIEFFADADGDGFGSGSVGRSCEAPTGSADRAGDCDDADAAVHPGAVEPICSMVDLDCDGSAGSAATQGGKAYATIQAAIEAAPERGQVLVCPGSRVESLTLSRGIRLASTTGNPADVRITAPDGGRVLSGNGSSVTLQGLTLAGTGQREVQDGGILYLWSNVLDIQDCRFEDGRVSKLGGAIWWRGTTSSRGTGASLTMERVVVADNQAGADGGALYLQPRESGGVRFDEVTFRDNSADGYGGAAFVAELAGSAVTWNASTSTRNEATRGAALYTTSTGAGSATTVLASSSTDDDGGAFVSGRRLLLDDVTIEGATGAAAAQASRITAMDVRIEDSEREGLVADELTVEDSALLRNGVGARARDDLRLIGVDVGTGSSANASDVRFAGRDFDFSGTVDARCSGSGCVEL